MNAVYKVGFKIRNRYATLIITTLLIVIAVVCSAQVYAQSTEKIIYLSDIDDTIIQSNVANKWALIRATILKKPKNVFGGMAFLYERLLAENPNASMMYLSATPTLMRRSMTQLLLQNEFPDGELILRRWIPLVSDITGGLVGDTIISSKKYKLRSLREVFRKNPDKKFVLIGDDVEFDPNIYTQIAREFPEQVKQIYIRRVIGRLPTDSEVNGIRQFSTELHIGLYEHQAERLSEGAVESIGKRLVDLVRNHPLRILPDFVRSFIGFDETAEQFNGKTLTATFKALLADVNRAVSAINPCKILLLGNHSEDSSDEPPTTANMSD